MSQDSYSVEVPEWLYADALAWIAQRLNERSPMSSPLSVDVPVETGAPRELVRVDDGSWSKEDIGMLSTLLKNPAGRAVVTAIAEAGQMGVSYDELREAGELAAPGNFSYNQLRAQLSWFSKYCIKVKGQNIWPITVKPRGGHWWYWMDETIAEWWLDEVSAS